MDLQITGHVTKVLDEEGGEGRNGPWRKRSFILTTGGEYPKEVCIIQWGDNIDKFAVQEGETITAHIDVQSREFKGRWYTDVKAWKVERKDEGRAPNPAPSDEPPPLEEPPIDLESGDDGLPF
jgi:hypothetical protein